MRCIGLDLLRISAVILVLIRHLYIPAGGAVEWLNVVQRGGWIGVDLFFVLSGFLVSGLLFSEFKKRGSIDIKRFLIRRGFKIYPPFWAFIFITIFVHAWLNHEINARALFGELVFLQNYTSSLWNHTWSLAVEEHFYFLIATVLWIMTSTRGGSLIKLYPLFFLIVAVACLVLRMATWQILPEFSFKKHVFPTHLRIDSLLFGSLLSYLIHFRELESRIAFLPTSLLAFLGSVMLAPAFVWPIEDTLWMSVYGFIVLYLGSGLLVLSAIRLPDSKSRILHLLGYLGAASYSIYLWHMPVNKALAWLIDDPTGSSHWLYVMGYSLGSLVVGLVMARIIEIPSLKIRAKLFPK